MAKRKDRGLRRGQGYVERRTGKDGTVFYVARWLEDGRYRSKVFRDTDPLAALEAAEQHIRDRDRALRTGRYIAPSDMTVTDLVDQHLARGESRWKPNTYATYCERVRACIERQIGSIKVCDLDPARAQYWIDQLVAEGWSAWTIQSARFLLGGAFKSAVRLGIVATSPLAHVEMPRPPRTEHETWTMADMAEVLAGVADDPMWHALYRVALVSGMRPGELMSLKWTDIDLDRVELMPGPEPVETPSPQILIQRTVSRDRNGRRIVGTSTKTDEDRAVAIPPACAAALRHWRIEQKQVRLSTAGWVEQGYVFTGRTGNRLAQSSWQNYHRKLCERVGVPRITHHELRHTNATIELAAGTHPKIVGSRLGHKDTRTTLDIYSHVSTALHRSATDDLERRLDQALADTTTSGKNVAKTG